MSWALREPKTVGNRYKEQRWQSMKTDSPEIEGLFIFILKLAHA